MRIFGRILLLSAINYAHGKWNQNNNINRCAYEAAGTIWGEQNFLFLHMHLLTFNELKRCLFQNFLKKKTKVMEKKGKKYFAWKDENIRILSWLLLILVKTKILIQSNFVIGLFTSLDFQLSILKYNETILIIMI